MVVGERHRILRRAGPLCRARYEIKRENRRPPSEPAARPAPCCSNPTPTIYLSSRRDFVEVLTECRDQHLERAEVRFVAAGARSNTTIGSDKTRYVAFRSTPSQDSHRKPNFRMCVVPSIIVLMITALLVFRREIIA